MEQVDKIITSKEEKTTIKQSFFYTRELFQPLTPLVGTPFYVQEKKKEICTFYPVLLLLGKNGILSRETCMCTREQKWTKCPNFKVI